MLKRTCIRRKIRISCTRLNFMNQNTTICANVCAYPNRRRRFANKKKKTNAKKNESYASGIRQKVTKNFKKENEFKIKFKSVC